MRRRHAERIEDDVHRAPVGQERHVLRGRMREITPLLPWRPAILSPARDLALLGDRDAHHLVDARPAARRGVALEDLDVDDLAALAVRHAQAGVLDLARLLAEDRAQQPLLGGQLGLALRRDLADQDVARPDLGADADDAVLVEVAQRILADVGDVARDLFGTQLGVARLDLVLLDVDRGERVVA